MLSATYLTSAIDFSKNLLDWQPEIIPSYTWTNLINGKLSQTYDLSASSDKFYSTIDLVFDYLSFNNFLNWYKVSRGQNISITSDLDLFFPDIYPNQTSAQIISYKDLGYLSDIWSQYRKIELKLYTPTIPNYSSTNYSNISGTFSRGVWKQDYKYTDTINFSKSGQFSEYTFHQNDNNLWSVDFAYLSRFEANNLLSWILTARTNTQTITTTGPNSNSPTGTKTSNYQIKDYKLQNQKSYYNLEMNFVEIVNR